MEGADEGHAVIAGPAGPETVPRAARGGELGVVPCTPTTDATWQLCRAVALPVRWAEPAQAELAMGAKFTCIPGNGTD